MSLQKTFASAATGDIPKFYFTLFTTPPDAATLREFLTPGYPPVVHPAFTHH